MHNHRSTKDTTDKDTHPKGKLQFKQSNHPSLSLSLSFKSFIGIWIQVRFGPTFLTSENDHIIKFVDILQKQRMIKARIHCKCAGRS